MIEWFGAILDYVEITKIGSTYLKRPFVEKKGPY